MTSKKFKGEAWRTVTYQQAVLMEFFDRDVADEMRRSVIKDGRLEAKETE